MAGRVFFSRARILSGLAVIIGLLIVTAWLFAISWRPAVADFPVQGVSVDERHLPIDWFTVRAGGASFGYARATIGADRRDPGFASHWAGMFEADVPRGAIHVFSLCRLAADQARFFVTIVPRTRTALPAALALDFTDDCTARPERNVVLAEISTFLSIVEAHSGKPVLLKLSPAFETQYRVGEALDRPLWLESTLFMPFYTRRPWRIWQASSIRRVEGVTQPVAWHAVAP